jgi:hypothetical protein
MSILGIVGGAYAAYKNREKLGAFINMVVPGWGDKFKSVMDIMGTKAKDYGNTAQQYGSQAYGKSKELVDKATGSVASGIKSWSRPPEEVYKERDYRGAMKKLDNNDLSGGDLPLPISENIIQTTNMKGTSPSTPVRGNPQAAPASVQNTKNRVNSVNAYILKKQMERNSKGIK